MKTHLIFIGFAFLLSSCRDAEYEIIKPGAGQNNGQDLTPPPNPNPTPPPIVNPNPPVDTNGRNKPTADLEVIVNSVATVSFPAGTTARLQPSRFTLDPDFKNSRCINPGIKTAIYFVDGQEIGRVTRTDKCENLGIDHIFRNPGRINVQMKVLSDDSEEAESAATVSVWTGISTPGGLDIEAIPLLAKVNDPIQFRGNCQSPRAHTIEWSLGNQTAVMKGLNFQYAYTAEGTYRVTAECFDENRQSLGQASLQITIRQDIPSTIPGYDPSRPGDGIPGQGPIQGPSQGPRQAPGQGAYQTTLFLK